MEFAKGYEDGFTGKPAQSNNTEYLRGYNLGVKQWARSKSGTNLPVYARIKNNQED